MLSKWTISLRCERDAHRSSSRKPTSRCLLWHVLIRICLHKDTLLTDYCTKLRPCITFFIVVSVIIFTFFETGTRTLIYYAQSFPVLNLVASEKFQDSPGCRFVSIHLCKKTSPQSDWSQVHWELKGPSGATIDLPFFSLDSVSSVQLLSQPLMLATHLSWWMFP